jgi:hypothetical protein
MIEQMSYFTDSVGWSALYFALGYGVCRAELFLRKLYNKKDH